MDAFFPNFLKTYKVFLFLFILPGLSIRLWAEDGYRLWLRYELVSDQELLESYKNSIKSIQIIESGETADIIRKEMRLGFTGLLGKEIPRIPGAEADGFLIIGLVENIESSYPIDLKTLSKPLSKEGFLIQSIQINGNKGRIITAKSSTGLLYGTFRFLQLLQSQQSIENLALLDNPEIDLRILNHWDNLDRTVERGYAGFSIWDWHKLPEYIDQRYIDYARANASIGINGTVLTNVNANALVLRADYLLKVKALADVFRPYGIKVFLTARFSAPIQLGGLSTADPLAPQVRHWWKEKVRDIYALIPDFGGFLVKANSEGQPGPQDYDRSHAEGANMLADAIEPYGGILMWRAFVYSEEEPLDRAKQANIEFEPLDGEFKDNVLLQVKNGPIDFMPREPFHPLFGAMPQTPLMMEFQITQEYLGQGTHLVYLAPMYKEVLEADTYAKGKGSGVADIINGRLNQQRVSAIAGVSNIGTDRNWTGHPFGQANWYAYGRLAWNLDLEAKEIAEEWIRRSFSNDPNLLEVISSIMMNSHEACVNYMTPLGLHHIMAANHHYGPGPWVSKMSRADWTSVYYHKADKAGLGFDRTPAGSNNTSQYAPEIGNIYASRELCPEKYLLWFHHVGWQEKLASGKTLWEELCYRYYQGVEGVRKMRNNWKSIQEQLDIERFKQVDMLLAIQEKEAIWWRNSCLLYFQQFSGLPFPKELEAPEHELEYYLNLSHPYAPGIRPRW